MKKTLLIKRRGREKNGFHALSSGGTVITMILKNSKVDKMTFITQNKCGVQHSHNF